MADTTFFDNIQRNFKDVTITANNEINTSEFLEAAESLVTLFDLLGSTAFGPVQNDMRGNIKKLRDRLLAAPGDSETLQSLVRSEMASSKKHTASEGLLWLTRGLKFTELAMRKNLDQNKTYDLTAASGAAQGKEEELSTSFKAAYSESLAKHHNFVVKQIFNVAMSACPYRNDFLGKLGKDREKVKAQLEEWVSALEKVVGIVEPWIEDLKKSIKG